MKCPGGDIADFDTAGSEMCAASYVATSNPEFDKILSSFHDNMVEYVRPIQRSLLSVRHFGSAQCGRIRQ